MPLCRSIAQHNGYSRKTNVGGKRQPYGSTRSKTPEIARCPLHPRFFAHMTGIRMADIRHAMATKPAGVALAVALTDTHFPIDTCTVALISSGWGAEVGESWVGFASMTPASMPARSDAPCSFLARSNFARSNQASNRPRALPAFRRRARLTRSLDTSGPSGRRTGRRHWWISYASGSKHIVSAGMIDSLAILIRIVADEPHHNIHQPNRERIEHSQIFRRHR
jgi:hypothetical protein